MSDAETPKPMMKRTHSLSLLALALGLAIAILARFCELHPGEAPVALALAGSGAFVLLILLTEVTLVIAVGLASAQNWGRARRMTEVTPVVAGGARVFR